MSLDRERRSRGGRIAVLVGALDSGGAERVALNLSEEFAEKGLPVDLVLVRGRGELLAQVPRTIRIIDLNARRARTAVLPFRAYVRQEQPTAILAINFEVNITAATAMIGLRTRPRLVLTVHSTPSQILLQNSLLGRLALGALSKLLYPRADYVVAVSEGAAADLKRLRWFPPSRLVDIPNPVIRPDFDRLAAQVPPHPWLEARTVPVVISVGRLTPAKDYSLLLRAFARVIGWRGARLIIVGEGEERPRLQKLVQELDLCDHVSFAGYQANPLAFLKQADLFVLSSTFEGFGNVIVEAMAAGTPVISTDCPNGPREILGDGRWGRLTPPGDIAALASAIDEALEAPLDQAQLEGARARALEFTTDVIAERYLMLLGGRVTRAA